MKIAIHMFMYDESLSSSRLCKPLNENDVLDSVVVRAWR